MKKCTCQAHDDRTGRITSTGGALAALLLAMARLGVALGLAAWLVVLVLIGAGLVIAVGAPLIEEFSKSVGVALLAARRSDLTPGAAFLWGAAAGAGFAITETMFNVAAVLPHWGGALVLRSATAVVHCLAAGLMGLAWQAWFSRERRWRLPALYGLAVVIHGLWNGVAGLASVLQAQGTLNDNLLVGAGGTLLVFALAGLFVINSGLFVYISVRLGRAPLEAR